MVVIIIVKIFKETPSIDIGTSTPLSKCSVCWLCVRNQINNLLGPYMNEFLIFGNTTFLSH